MLGYVWALLDPLLMMCVFLLVFGLFLEIQIERYPIFLLSGLVPWNFFAGAVQQSVDSLTRNRGLIEKLYCPREIFPLAVVLSNAVNMGFTCWCCSPSRLSMGPVLPWHAPYWRQSFGS